LYFSRIALLFGPHPTDLSDFIDSEFADLDLGDKRRSARLRTLLRCMLDSPMKTIASACRGWAETIGAYRLLNNERVDSKAILAPHREATIQRARQHDCVAVAQDTTELDYTRKKSLQGSGPLSQERRGFYAHTQFVVSRDRLPLGVLGTNIFARDDEDFRRSRKHDPIEEKESCRWIQGYQECCEFKAELTGTEVLSISDREGDIYELYDCWRKRLRKGKSTAQWLVRASQDRALLGEDDKPLCKEPDSSEITHLFEQVRQGRELGEIQFEVKAARQKKKTKGTTVITQRQARLVRQRITVCEVTPRPPQRKGGKAGGRQCEPVSFHAVLAEEIDTPDGQEPITWLLLTSRRIESFEDAKELIGFYLGRWEIEVFHRVLKTGCRVEELQLRDSGAVINAVTIYMIVAWRILYLTHLGRSCPELPCGVVFEEAEWKSVVLVERAAQAKKKKSGSKRDGSKGQGTRKLAEPSLAEMILLVAKQGGHLGRKGDGPPGPQVMWQGLERVRNFAEAWQAFGDPDT
jgi:hypothetical protein